jgi:hypothetical protein
MEPTVERKAILILYDDGQLDVPGAATFGDLLARCRQVGQIGATIERQLLAQPLPTAVEHPEPGA